MAEVNARQIFAAFRRLQDFPIDITSLYNTLEDASTYIALNKTAYAGQVIAVCNDSEEKNNGVYMVIEDKFTGRLTLKKSANQEDLNKLAETITNEVNKNIEKIADIIGINLDGDETNPGEDSIVTRIERIKELIPESASVNNKFATEADIQAIVGERISEFEQIQGAVDTINEISVWIQEHEDILGQLHEITERWGSVRTIYANENNKVVTPGGIVVYTDNSGKYISDSGVKVFNSSSTSVEEMGIEEARVTVPTIDTMVEFIGAVSLPLKERLDGKSTLN